MSIKFGAAILGAASLLLVSDAKALTFELDETFNGSTPASSTPWLTATFTQGLNGAVNLALQSSLSVSSEFFGSLGFNFNPAKSLQNVSMNGDFSVVSVDFTPNGENLVGGGDDAKGFDLMISFVTANNANERFQGTDLINFIFSGTTPLTPGDFDFFNATGKFKIAAHIQGFPDGKSGAITGETTDDGATVPDGGSTLILLGIGTTLCALARRTIAS